MLLSQARGLATTAPIAPVVVLIAPAPRDVWGGVAIQFGRSEGLSRDFGLRSEFHIDGPWGGPQGGGWGGGPNSRSQIDSNSEETAGISSSTTPSPGDFDSNFSGVDPNAAPSGPAPMTATPPASPDAGPSAAGPATGDDNAASAQRGPTGPSAPAFFRPRAFAAASLAASPMGSAPSAPGSTNGPQSMGNFAATPGPNPADPPPPPNGPPPAVMAAGAGMPSTAQPLVEPGGGWTSAATVSLVGPRGPATVMQASVTSHDATKALMAGVPNSAPATIAIQSGIGTIDDRTGDSPTAQKLEAAAPQAAGVLTAFMPLDPEAIEASLEKLLERIDALGAPIAASQDRLPIVIPVAIALAAMETARRRLGKTSTPGPAVGRGSRLSSLRGLS